MDASDKYKKALENRALKALGKPSDQPNATGLQSKVTDEERRAILKLPAKIIAPAQDLRPSSPTYGKFMWIAGAHPIGSADYLIGGF